MSFILEPSKSFEKIPAGTYAAEITGLIDLGTQEREYMGKALKPCRQINIVLSIRSYSNLDKVVGDTILFGVTASLSNPTSSKKSFLTKLVGITELTGEKDISKLLGKRLSVTMSDNKDGSRTYVDKNTVSPLPSIIAFESKEPHVQLSIDETFNQEVFNSLSDFTKDIIRKSPEYKAISTVNLII